MADEDTLFSASVDDKGVVRFFDVLDDKLDAAGKNAAFDKLQAKVDKFAKAAGKAGTSKTAGVAAIGAAFGAALVVVNQLINALDRGITTLVNFTAGAVSLADKAESASINFTNILGGNEDAALAFMDQMNEKALDLGVSANSLTSFSKSLLPDAKSVAEFEKLVEAAVTLDKSDPDKTIDDVRFAFEEALSGNFRSLIQRFDLPKAVAEDAKKAIAEGASSVGGLLAALEKEFDRTGVNIESQQVTLTSMMAKTSAELEFLQAKLGEPIQDSLQPILKTIVDFLENNREDLQLFAASLGDIVADLVDLAGVKVEGILDFDPALILETADVIGDIVTVGKEFFKVLGELDQAAGALLGTMSGAPEPLREVDGAATDVSKTFNGFVESLLEATLTAAKFKAVIVGLKVFLKTWGDIDEAQRAADEAFAKSTVRLEDLRASLDDNNQVLAERKASLNKSTKAELDFVQAILSEKDALKKLQKQQESVVEADKALIKLRTQLAKRLVAADIEAFRTRIDLEKRESRRREDLAKADAKARLGIIENAVSDRQSILENADADILTAEKNAADESRSIERDKRDDLLGLEKEYRRELDEIQRVYFRTATEAQIANDVSAFLSAKRSRDDSLKDAKRNRGESEKDIESNAKKQQLDVKKALDQSRKDLGVNLQEQLDAVDENQRLQTEFFESGIVEREEAHKLALKREEEDRQLSLERQKEDLLRSLQDQLSALKDRHGEFIDVTAEGLLTQSQEYLDTYGPQGNIDGIMDDFFKRQQERLAELSESRAKIKVGIEEAKEKIADLERQGEDDKPKGFGGPSGPPKLFLPIIEKKLPSPAEQAAQRRQQEFLDRLAELERSGVRGRTGQGQIGQSGLVSEFLANSTNRVSPVSFRGGDTINNNSRSDTLKIDMEGVEPYLQRVATQAALEIFRNVTAGRGA